jgi:hypothetical protein
MTSTEETPRQGIRPPYAGVGLAVFAMLTTLVGVFTFGFLSGIPIVIAWAAIIRARRVGNSIAIRVSWAALAFTVIGAAFSYWFWQSILWDMHYHPGGGGPLPAPSTLALASMPLIATGIGVAAFVVVYLVRRVLARRSEHASS